MAEDPNAEPPVNSASPNTTQNNLGDSGGISAPREDNSGNLDLEARSVRDVAQALGICTTAETNNRTRAVRAKVVQDVHDMAAPRSFGEKINKGQAWQDNYSTGILSGICQRVNYRMIQAITTSPFLSYSALPETVNMWKVKTDLIRAAITELYRDWAGFIPLINQISSENTLQGYTLPLFLNPLTWKPTFHKQERVLIPEGATMDVAELQWIVCKFDYPIQKFVAMFGDEKAAKDSGYNIEHCELSATMATLADPAADYATTEPRRFTEMVNQGTVGLTYAGGSTRCVLTYLMFNVEYDGKVSMWLLDRKAPADKALLRYAHKCFDSMGEVAGLICFEPGNGTVHSSKGVGRRLLNLAMAQEVTRNEMSTLKRLAGLLLIKADAISRMRMLMQVNGPFMVLPDGVNVQEQKFSADSQGLQELDSMMSGWAEQGAGAYISDVMTPGQENSKDTTATAKRIDFAREQESAAMAISRWQDQIFGSVFGLMQCRAFSDRNLKKAAKLFQKITADPKADRPSLYEDASEDCDCQLMRKLVQVFKKWPDFNAEGGDVQDAIDEVIDQIAVWRDSPATLGADILKAQQAAAVTGLTQMFGSSPNFNAQAAMEFVTENAVGPDLAAKFLIPNIDQTVVAEATRQQMTETTDMIIQGMPVPVSARDNHAVHGATAAQWLQMSAAPRLSQVQTDQDSTIAHAGLVLNHLGEHLQFMLQQGQSGTPEFMKLKQFFDSFKGQLQQVIKIHAEMVAAAQLAHAKISGGGLPAPAASPDGAQPSPTPAPGTDLAVSAAQQPADTSPDAAALPSGFGEAPNPTPAALAAVAKGATP